ncbi:hypothetical protein D3C72_1898150 [compost metagenome]
MHAGRLEQVAQPKLEARHARMGAGQLGGQPQRPRRFDIQQQPDLANGALAIAKPIRPLGLLDGCRRTAHVIGALRLGQVDQMQTRYDHRCQIGLEM